VAYHHLLSLK